MNGKFLALVFVIALFAIAAIFIPIIFGSAEASIDLTNNTTKAQYMSTVPIIMSGQSLMWIGAALCGLFLLVGILVYRGR
jgi:hypothetical protein